MFLLKKFFICIGSTLKFQHCIRHYTMLGSSVNSTYPPVGNPPLIDIDKRVIYKEKTVSHHPWEKTIKDRYYNEMKYAHNFIPNNLHYPPGEPGYKKEKVPDKNPVKFTIIGNRVSKEFIYCVNLVKGMHKYRWKTFDAPVVKGLTTVEWPIILHELKVQYGGIAHCLKSQVVILYNDKLLGGEDELKELLESKYIYYLALNYQKESVRQFVSFVGASGRPCVYMHISINEEHVGTMIFMLYADVVPFTCENFLRLCRKTKGGYSGTPVHRIVKNGWVQCGGYGLKSAELDCENFIIPPDRRGAIGMANDGRHNDCSTQFFVLLEPAPWMAYKYVVFGQLISGASTLELIENVPTWYESPKSSIIIHSTGILNLDCNDIMINRGAKEYIQGHVENLVTIGDTFIAELMERVNLEIEFRRIARLEAMGEAEGEEEMKPSITYKNLLSNSPRFIRKKEQIQQNQQQTQDSGRPSTAASRATKASNKDVNNDFDVEDYVYEPEEFSYQHLSPVVSIPPKPEIPFYIPLTDVPYPDEKDSTFDLKRFLHGDYCLASDLISADHKKKHSAIEKRMSYMSELFSFRDVEDESDQDSDDVDSDQEREIKSYMQHNMDRVSFAGGVIKNIARSLATTNLFQHVRQSDLITDDELRRFRLASQDMRSRRESKKVSISVPHIANAPKMIKRRQTGFVRPQDLAKVRVFTKESSESVMDGDEDNDPNSRKVRIAPSTHTPQHHVPAPRRPTGFARPDVMDANTNVRPSVLQRLYEDVTYDVDETGPTLKDYRPASESHPRNSIFLTQSNIAQFKSDESIKERYMRPSVLEESFVDHANIVHGKKVARKISSDYVQTMDRAEKTENSIRSLEFAKTRPTMTISEYQLKNRKDDLQNNKTKSDLIIKYSVFKSGGLRLPGDSPLYSETHLKPVMKVASKHH